MFEFAWIWVWIIAPLPYLFWRMPRKEREQGLALRVPSLSHFESGSRTAGKHWIRLLLLCVIWLLLVGAAARPQWLGEPMAIPAEGRDLMLAVDLSGSMKNQDMTVNGRRVDRLQMIKSVLDDFIARRVGDRLGLILFADTAYLQAPLTYDRDTVAQLLDESVIGLVGEQTAIGDAIGLAVKRFEEKKQSNKVLILLTDGQNTAGNITPEQATELAMAKSVTVYTIGVGSGQGDSMGFSMFFNNAKELDEASLTRIAEQTGGRYFRAKDTQSLEAIYEKLDELEPIERESRKMRPLTALFFYPLSLALLLSVLLAASPLINRFVRGNA